MSTEEAPEAARLKRVAVRIQANSRLEALHAQYEHLRDEAAAAKQRFDDLKKAITAELEDLYPDDERPSEAYDVPASQYGPGLTVAYREQYYLPAGAIQKAFPAIYEAFRKRKSYSEVRDVKDRQR